MVSTSPIPPGPKLWHFLALMGGNVALAFGPTLVRWADSGPVAAGFWRLTLALPVIVFLARFSRQPLIEHFSRATWLAVAGAGVLFALDLASWHVGIGATRLGNATLFGNSGAVILMVWALIVLRRAPSQAEAAAIGAALAGSAILFGRSLEVSWETLVGDLFCLLAGLFYAGYILLAQGARGRIGGWALLTWSILAGAPVLLAVALLRGEPVWPRDWTPLLTLALTSQIIGQGLLVFALGHFRPLTIGLVLLTQPVVSIIAGWWWFAETLSGWDALGMALVAGALVIARADEPRATPENPTTPA
jgi:drug/metabolite transporter (DMT)-like permease